MTTTIQIKRGNGTPADSTLAQGELAVDLSSGSLFTSTNGTDIITVGGGSGTLPGGSTKDTLTYKAGSWQTANAFFIDDSSPGVSNAEITGTIKMTNLGVNGGVMNIDVQDNALGDAMVYIYGTSADDGVQIAPNGIGVGDVFTFTGGQLTLPNDPTANMHAATKQYVDNATSGTVEAGTTTNAILRFNGTSWVENTAVTVTSTGTLASPRVQSAWTGTKAADDLVRWGDFLLTAVGISNTNTITGVKTFTQLVYNSYPASTNNPASSLARKDYVDLAAALSDVTLKDNIEPIDPGFAMALLDYDLTAEFDWNDGPAAGKHEFGWKAQDVIQAAGPAAGFDCNDLKGINLKALTALLFVQNQEQQKLIDQLMEQSHEA